MDIFSPYPLFLAKNKNKVKDSPPSHLPTDHLSLQCAEELWAAAPDHRGGSVGGVLLQPTAVQPWREHGGGADAVHQQRHIWHQEPAHWGHEATVWDEGQGVSRDWWVMGRDWWTRSPAFVGPNIKTRNDPLGDMNVHQISRLLLYKWTF